jgi:hypothetical protein
MAVREKVVDRRALDSMSSIAIGMHDFHNVESDMFQSVYSTFDSTLVAELNASGLFRTVTVWDSLKIGIDLNADTLAEQLFAKARQGNMAGLLFSRLDIVNSTYMFIPVHDAIVTLNIYDTEHRALVLTVQYNTRRGMTTDNNAHVEDAVRNATRRAVDALVTAMNRGK